MATCRWAAIASFTLGLAPGSWAQAEPAAPVEATPWRWMDPDRQPFQPWHTDTGIQARLLADARSRVEDIVGITLEAPPDIAMAPGWAFFYAGMETGAKDGSLLLDISATRAMERLSFVAEADAKPESIGPDWRGDPASVGYHARGVYVPQHVRRMIWINPDLADALVASTLEHEYVHALQDEAYPFKEFFAFEGITVDEKLARQAIEEGYAVLVAGLPERPGGGPAAEQLDTLDWSARLLMLFYGSGGLLVERLAAGTESRRALLDVLFLHPPATTREVLHPDLFEERLESARPPELAEPESFSRLRDALTAGLAGAGQPEAWRSRLGEFTLQSVLVELGMSPDEAAAVAAGWRNDTVTNHGDWRSPTTTATVWCLSTAEEARALAGRMAELLEARGAILTRAAIRGPVELPSAQVSLQVGALPQVLLIQDGQAIGYVVGAGLDGLVPAEPPR